MSNITVNQLPDSNQLDKNDYVVVYNSENSADNFTYKSRIEDVLALKEGIVSVNSKTGSTVTLSTDDLSDSSSSNKFVTQTEKNKIAIVRNDLGSNVVLHGDGVYRGVSTSSGNVNYTVNTIGDRDLLVVSHGDRVVVVDASADPTVDTGSAMYYWSGTLGAWSKIAEYESLDFQFPPTVVTGATNLGTIGHSLFTSVSSSKIQLRRLVPGNNISLTSTSTGITITNNAPPTTASEGLTKIGNDIRLGGLLTQPTSISGDMFSGLGLSFDGSNGEFSSIATGLNSYVNDPTVGTVEIISFDTTTNQTLPTINFNGSSGKFGIGRYDQTGTHDVYIEAQADNSDVGTLQVVDNRPSKKGLVTSATGYVTDPRSYADKEYVDSKLVQAITNGLTTAAPSSDVVFDALALKSPIVTASEGITKVGNDFQFGGTVTANNIFEVGSTAGSVTTTLRAASATSGGTSNLLFLLGQGGSFQGASLQVRGSNNVSGRPAATLSNNAQTLTFESGDVGSTTNASVVFNDQKGIKTGIQYAANGYVTTARSLTDAAFVTGITTNLATTANNGLIKSGNNIRFGGALTGNTTISGAFGLTFNALSTFSVSSAANATITATALSLGSQGGGNNLSLTANGGGLSFNGGTTTIAGYGLQVTKGFNPTNGSSDHRGIQISTTLNTTLTHNGTLYGIDYSPTITSIASGATHIAARLTSGSILVGSTTLTPSTRLDVRGIGTTTGNIIRLANSSNQEIFTIKDNGQVNLRGTIGSNTNVPLFSVRNSSANLSSGLFDLVLGGHTGNTLTTGTTAGNISIGSRNLNSLKAAVTEFDGGRNIAIGYENHFVSNTGTHHILIGRQVQRNATWHGSGQNGYNIGIGYEVFRDAINLNEANVAFGLSAAKNIKAPAGATYGVSYNTIIGEQAGINAVTNASNIIIGDWAGRYYSGNSANVIIGTQAAELARLGANPNTQGNSNIIIGIQAGRQIKVTSGSLDYNVLIGVLAGNNVSGGTHSVALGPETYKFGKGTNSTAIGRWAGARFHGDNNSGFGAYAGYHASLNLTGSSNTFIGHNAGYSSGNISNTIVIASNWQSANLSNKIYLGNTSQKVVLNSLPTTGSTSNAVLVRNTTSGEIESRNNFVDTTTSQLVYNKYLISGTTVALRISGATQNNSATKVLALTTGNTVVWKDSNSFGSSSFTSGLTITHSNPSGVFSAGKEVLVLKSTVAGDDPTIQIFQANGLTTNAGAIGFSHPTVSNTVYFVKAIVVARRTGGIAGTAGDGASYCVVGSFSNSAGTLNQIGTTTNLWTHESQAGWNVALATSGTDIQLTCTGAANNNITWHVVSFEASSLQA